MPDRSADGRRRGSARHVLGFIFASGLAVVSSIGLLGYWDDWADIVNQFAPIWFCIAAAGLLAIALTGGWRRAPWSGALLLFAVIAQATLAGPEVLAGDRLASSNMGVGAAPPFRVLTFNVWNDSRDSAATIDRIVASGADVVTLQEALGLERLSSAALTAAYPYRATCDDWWGCEILILSKRPILDHHYAAPKPEGSGGPLWAVWITTTATDGRPVRVLSTHFAWPVPPGFRQDQVERLGEIVRTLKGGSLIVTGDCNADGSSFALRDQDAELDGLVRRTRQIFSWPAIVDGTHWPAPFPVLAIDQIYASRDWRTTEVRRLPRAGSDHYPILVGLERDERRG
jgi:endonuclease/exonuclease/phosphatase (EEP) superfamily protein YafD